MGLSVLWKIEVIKLMLNNSLMILFTLNFRPWFPLDPVIVIYSFTSFVLFHSDCKSSFIERSYWTGLMEWRDEKSDYCMQWLYPGTEWGGKSELSWALESFHLSQAVERKSIYQFGRRFVVIKTYIALFTSVLLC